LGQILVLVYSPNRFRQAEVQHFHPALRRDLYVGWFQVAMDNAFFVGRVKGLGNLARVIERSLYGHRSAQRLALDQFHH
jgi:hypothetical protein